MGESFQQFVSKVVIILAFSPQALSVECDRARQIQRFGIKVPTVGRNEPGPSEDISLAKRLDGDVTAFGREQLKRNTPLAYEIELVGLFSFVKDELILLESHVGGTTSHKLQGTPR